MPSIEDTLDSIWSSVLTFGDGLYRTGLVYSLVLVNWASWVWETGYHFTRKSLVGAINAHKDQEFIFLERNSCPWQRHRQEEELGVLRIQYPMIYDVNSSHYSFPLTASEEDASPFSDVVTAELVNSDETICFDLSSFFHNVTCDVGSAPSLFEVVLTYCLQDDLLFTLEKLRGLRLKVFTVDGNERIVSLADQTRPFTSWTEYEEGSLDIPVELPAEDDASPAPSATSAANDSQESKEENQVESTEQEESTNDSHEA
jgi:hypothetical protein